MVQVNQLGDVQHNIDASVIRFDRILIALYCAFFSGIGLDAWAHGHGLVAANESFFTPWHIVMYGSFLVLVLFVGRTMVANYLPGKPLWASLPAGYGGLLVGVEVFIVAGVGDFIWHTLFGFEVDIQAIFSPTHLLLATGMVLILSAPFRAAWLRAKDQTALNFLEALPTLISIGFFMSIIGIMLIYTHPIGHVHYPADTAESGIAMFAAGVVIHTVVVMAITLMCVRRWKMPFGSFTVIFTLNIAFLALVGHSAWLIPFYTAAGLITDFLIMALKPSSAHLPAFRRFAFAVPVVIYALLFFAAFIQAPISWSIHVWTGTLLVAGFVGLLTSYLVLPPVGAIH